MSEGFGEGYDMSASLGAPPPILPSQKKSVWVWIAVGCAGLVILGILAVLLGGLVVFRKFREAGVDQKLLEKNPVVAAARMAVAMNPDLTIVATDEGKGILTVRNKKDGKTYTVNLEEASKGRIVLREDGKEALVVETQPNGQGNLRVQSGASTLHFGPGATDIPAWLPAYPGVTAQGTFASKTEEGESGSFGFTAPEPATKVIDFYKSALEKAGLKVATNVLSANDQATTANLTAEDPASQKSVLVNAFAEGASSRVQVSWNTKNTKSKKN